MNGSTAFIVLIYSSCDEGEEDQYSINLSEMNRTMHFRWYHHYRICPASFRRVNYTRPFKFNIRSGACVLSYCRTLKDVWNDKITCFYLGHAQHPFPTYYNIIPNKKSNILWL